MKKHLLISLLLILSLVLICCNNEPQPTPGPQPVPPEEWDNSQAYMFFWDGNTLKLKEEYQTMSSFGTLIIPDTVDSKTVDKVSVVADLAQADNIMVPPTIVDLFVELGFVKAINIPKSVTTLLIDSTLSSISIEEGSVYTLSENSVYKDNGTVLVKVLSSAFGEYVFSSSVTKVADYAFRGCNSITKLTIPATVEMEIGRHAFYTCGSLQEVSINNAITTIGEDAFYGCIDLNKITIPDTVAIIGVGAFRYCESLSIFDLKNVTDIGNYAFMGCSSLKYKNDNADLFVIPAAVTKIGSHAFEGCKALTTITVPDAYLGEYIFSGCTALETVTLPTSLSKMAAPSIPSGMFLGCSSLTNVTLPTNIETIGINAFNGCSSTGFTTITIPDPVNTISVSAFEGCSNLSTVNINTSANGSSLTSIGGKVFYNCTKLTSITLPNTMKVLAYYAFAGSGLTSFTVPTNSELLIGEGLFSGCKSLTSVTLPDSLKTIGDYMFSGCTALNAADVEGLTNVTKIGEGAFSGCSGLTGSLTIPSNVTTIGDYAFANCSKLTGVTIPSSVTSLGERLFSGCSKLSSVTISCSMTAIGDSMFEGCAELTTFTVPSGVKSIGSSAFRGCSKLSSFDFNGTTPTSIGNHAFDGCTALTSISLPAGITSIGDYAFAGSGLESIDMSGMAIDQETGFATIGASAFEGCLGLVNNYTSEENKTIKFPNIDDPSTTERHERLVIGNSVFKNCSNLKKIDFSENAEMPVDYETFRGCGSLVFIRLPKGVTKIGDSAFEGMSALKEIQFYSTSLLGTIGKNAFRGSGLTTINICGISPMVIDSGAFSNCTSLSTIILPNILYISSDLFAGCTGLTSITIPKTVGEIGSSAFKNLTNLTTVTFATDCAITKIGDSAFEGCTGLTGIPIPNSVKKIGASAFKGCTSFAIAITIPDSVTEVGNEAFAGCSSLPGLVFPANAQLGLGTVGPETFADCSALTSVTLPNNVKTIGAHAFEGKTNLTTVAFYPGSTLAEIGISAFNGCTALNNMTIPNSVVVIGDSAFKGCTALASVSIPQKVLRIDTYAFKDCTGLTSLTFANNSILQVLGNYAFEGCSALTSLNLPNNILSLPSDIFKGCTSLKTVDLPMNAVMNVSSSTFVACKATLENVVLSNSTIAIEADAFNGYGALKSVTFHDGAVSLHEIGNNAFKDCSLLAAFTIPSSVGKIGTDAFNGCAALTSIVIPEGAQMSLSDTSFAGCANLTNIQLPKYIEGTENARRITPNTFIACVTNLQTIKLPNNLVAIEFNATGAFEGFAALTSVMFYDGANYLETIGDNAFKGCSNLATFTIPSSVTSVGTNAFYGCAKLTSIVVPEGATMAISDSTFTGCSALTEVALPKTLSGTDEERKITPATFGAAKNTLKTVKLSNNLVAIEFNETGAFEGFAALTSVMFYSGTNSLVTIGNNAFKGCSVLETLVIPDSVTTIGNNAFKGCSVLETLIIPDSVTSIGTEAFNGCAKLAELFLPAGVTNMALTADTFAGCSSLTKIELPSSVSDSTSITSSTFTSCKNVLQSIKLPNNLSGVAGAFEGFGALKSVTFHEGANSLTAIGNNAFKDCIKLTSFIVPDSVTTIGASAFSGDTALKTVTLSLALTTIGNSAFSGVTALNSITFPVTLTTIGDSAFSGDTVLSNITYNGTKAAWGSVGKGSNAFNEVGTSFVHCTDGDAPLTPTTP